MREKVKIPQMQILENSQHERDLDAKLKKKNIEETKAMEIIFSRSCGHSGIHAYTHMKRSE